MSAHFIQHIVTNVLQGDIHIFAYIIVFQPHPPPATTFMTAHVPTVLSWDRPKKEIVETVGAVVDTPRFFCRCYGQAAARAALVAADGAEYSTMVTAVCGDSQGRHRVGRPSPDMRVSRPAPDDEGPTPPRSSARR